MWVADGSMQASAAAKTHYCDDDSYLEFGMTITGDVI